MRQKNIFSYKTEIGLIGVVYIIFALAMLWMSITSTIQAFKDPKLTRTELTLLIPSTFVLNFQESKK